MAVQISGNDITVPRDGSFTRNVTIGGTLTYEDVTNIDSVGLVTARNGIEIGARPGVAASISVDGNMIVSGISTFGGALSGTTGSFSGIVQSGQFKLLDNAKAIYGTGGDMEIYHNATNTVIQNGTGTLQIVNTGSDLYQQAAANITFNTNGSNERVRINSDGKVGLGTTGSDYALSIREADNNNKFLMFQRNSGQQILQIREDGNNHAIIDGSHASGELHFYTAGSERLRIDSSGRLLIGTDTARAVGGESNPRLHLEGTGATSNSWVNLTRFAANNGSANIQFAKSRSNTAGDYTVVQNGDNLGQISFLGADGTDMANYAALIKSQVDGTPGSNDMPGKLVFATTADGAGFPTPRMEINSAGIVTCRTVPSFKISIDSDTSPNSGTVSENNGFGLSEFRDGFNEGNHFSEATGRFTAPVEGLYYFHFSLMRYSNNGSGSVEMRIKRNGGQILARAYKANYSHNFESNNVSTITRLLAGHYVEFVIGVNMSTYNDDSYMMGYLIG